MTALHPLLRAAAAHGLGLAIEAPERAPSADEWDIAKAQIAQHRLVGLLAAAHRAGAVVLTEEQVDWLADRHLAGATRVLDIEAVALPAIDALETSGIPTRCLKGLAVSHLDYDDPSWRLFNDADLLVRSDDLPVAVDVLRASGYRRELPERRPGFDRRFAKDVTLHGDQLVEIDLHRLFAVGVYGQRQRLADVWQESEPFEVGGRQLRAPVAEDRFLHACFASVLAEQVPRVAMLRDVAQLLLSGKLRSDVLADRLDAWGCAAVVGAAVARVEDALGPLPRDALPAPVRAPGRRTAPWLRAYPAFGGSFGLSMLSGVFALRPSDATSYLRSLVKPSTSYRRRRAEAGRGSEMRLLWRRESRR